MIRETTHGNAVGKPDFAARERKLKLLRNCLRVLAHHLPKITYLQKHDCLRVELLRVKITAIDGADCCVLFGRFLFRIGLLLHFRLFGSFALNDGLVRYHFFVRIIYNFDFRLLALIGFFDFFRHEIGTNIQLFDERGIFPVRVRKSVQTDVLRFGKARLAIQRIRDPFCEQTVVLFVTGKFAMSFQISIYAVVNFTVIAPPGILIQRSTVQYVQTDKKVFKRQSWALIPPVSVCIVRVEYELLIAVMIVVDNALSAFYDPPAHCVPFFERVADGRVRALYYDLAGIVQIDVLVLRDKPVKVFKLFASFEHCRDLCITF